MAGNGQAVDGKSILGILLLAAGRGRDVLTVTRAKASDEDEALDGDRVN